jgi:phosphatidylglycerol---prolipoprotein diacylglyceryl transferase
MLPVLFHFLFDGDASKVVLYLLALALVAYAARTGWETADGGKDAAGKLLPPSLDARRNGAIFYGVVGALAAAVGMAFASPNVPFVSEFVSKFFKKGLGEGIPLPAYGVLVGAGFLCGVTVAGWLAKREWPGEKGVKQSQMIYDWAFYVFLAGIGGSRILFVLVNRSEYLADPARKAEGTAVLFDIAALLALTIGITFREKLFSDVAFREKLLKNGLTYFIYVFIGGRLFMNFIAGGKGLGGIGDMLGGGLVFYGGLIGSILVSLWYCEVHGIQFLRLADLAIPAVSLGQALGRLGCFSAGCCWGDVTTKARAPFAVEFPGPAMVKTLLGNTGPSSSLAYSSQSDFSRETRYVVESTGEVFAQAHEGAVRIAEWATSHGHSLPVHPTQLYESFGQTVLFALLLTMRRFRRFHGHVFGTWLMCYAVLRSSVELFRGDLERGTLHGLLKDKGFTDLAEKISTQAWYNLSTSQFISLCLFALGAWILFKNFRSLPSIERSISLSASSAA